MVQTEERLTGEVPAPVAPSLGAFSVKDWLLLAATALTWGSSFVWIEIGLEAFSPTFITLLRLVFGAGTLVFVRQARAPIAREDLPAIALLGLVWMAAPLLLFPIAQQWIASSLAGMINGSMPIFAGVIAAVVLRRLPPSKTMLGIALGFIGVVAVSWPAVQGSSATALGAGLVLAATICYGIAVNLAVPLQQKYGTLPIILRAQLFALAITFVPGIIGATSSSFDAASLAAMIPLGCLGTGLAFVWMGTLVGRVGAARGSVTIYFVPVIAIMMGALFRSESIAVISIVGTALVLAGAFITSRTQTRERA
ncbi:MAG TPA: DMT family transporter [Actinomycetota bacterium]|nr:DMT family transporter [Actinomycetota bacterium]